ncbi:Hypothetical protein R9X50_00529100 [Acrodontium crateriforme]|uniref:FAD-binding domain-containing protein n=1 Tax=Acrodontium crateriforme TaxID=150365 RepID=A0AAQ3M5U2_9PEZI|nr:Hypothetical protein R9X50_00529100 [Acrodontium crateriforme]
MSLKIAIIGAGPAGCMLARLLIHNSTNPSQQLNITIFEGEATPNFRSQGGTLDLHEKTGLLAVRQAGLWDDFRKLARYDGEAMKIADKNFLCYLNMSGASDAKATGGRPEIDRPQLRELLYRSMPENIVRWGHKLVQVDEDQTLHFANGYSEGGFDLIVGADGAWSRVRPVVSDEKPFYSGVAGHAFSIPNAAENHAELYRLVNRGSIFSFSDGKSIMAQQMSDGSISIGTWSVRPHDWRTTCGIDVHNGQAVKEMAKREFKDWDERLVRFTQVADDTSISPRDLYMLPIGHAWKHHRGITLIGDAAHLMTPFAGEGVNLALKDSLALSEAILSAFTSTAGPSKPKLDEAVAAFEAEMFVQSTKTQQLTFDMMNHMYFTPNAPRVNIATYVSRAIDDEFGVWMWLVRPLVYSYFFLFKLIW